MLVFVHRWYTFVYSGFLVHCGNVFIDPSTLFCVGPSFFTYPVLKEAKAGAVV